jgi:hypothetical protein
MLWRYVALAELEIVRRIHAVAIDIDQFVPNRFRERALRPT